MQKDADLVEATLFELLLEMDAAGFDCKELTRYDVSEATKNPFTVGVSSKTWFKRAGHLAYSRFY